MRLAANVLILLMMVYGLLRLWPLISVSFFSTAEQLEGEILVCDLIPEQDRFRMHIIYEYCVDMPDARQCVLASQLSDFSGNPVEAPLLSPEEAALYQPMLSDIAEISAALPRPIVFIDPEDPLNSGRLYLAFDQKNFRYAVLCIALPMMIWLSSLLLRSFLLFQHEPRRQGGV